MSDKNQTKDVPVCSRWQQLLEKYRGDDRTGQLILVQYTGESRADLTMFQKTDGQWEKLLSCPAFVGKNGIGKTREGDTKTPIGVFELTLAFGIRDDPGAHIPYVKIHENLYWCGDEKYYNTLIDITEKPHNCRGEHLIDYDPQYNYGMVLDYNKECIYGEGSAIFLHCTGDKKYTGGCIAVEEEAMVKILQKAKKGIKICIDTK